MQAAAGRPDDIGEPRLDVEMDILELGREPELARFDLGLDLGEALPELAFSDADDKPLTLADYKGKVVLVNFWATWCAPCVKEMPSLDRLQAAIGKDKLVVLPLSLDGSSRAKVAPFYADNKLANI